MNEVKKTLWALEKAYKEAYVNANEDKCIEIANKITEYKNSIVEKIDKQIEFKQSMPLSLIIDIVQEERKKASAPAVFHTGIHKLDMELVEDEAREMGINGGLLKKASYRLWAGKSGMGKTTLLLQIMLNLAKSDAKVAWIDFEMGRDRAVRYALKREPKGSSVFNNIEYYDGNRELSTLVKQIKILKACGAQHFFIDSVMKLSVKGKSRGYETVSEVHDVLQKLTRDLEVSIDIIAQMSNEDIKNKYIGLKHGGDAEYEADAIFYLMPLMKKLPNGRIERNEAGVEIAHKDKRLLICAKNRETDRLFEIELSLEDIFGTAATTTYTYQSDNNVDMPYF